MAPKGSRKGYSWLKSWLSEHLAEDGRLRDDAAGTLLEAAEPEALRRWLPRLFWESHEQQRKGILQAVVPVVGAPAVDLLKEVLASPKSGLAEKGLAAERLEALSQQPDEVLLENLRRAESFLAALPGSLAGAETAEQVPEEVLAALDGLSPPFRGAVLRELVARPPERGFLLLERVLIGRDALWEEVLAGLEEAPHEGAGSLLRAGYAVAGKPLRKKIRRVHHRRNVRGLPALPLDAEEEEEAVWKPPVPPRPEGLLSIPDPAGARTVWVIRPNVRKGMLVFGGWVEEQRGLLKFFVMDASRKELDRYKESLLESKEFTVVECDPGFCASILDDAYRRGAPLDPEEAEAFTAVRPVLKEVIPTERPAAPAYAVYPEAPEEAELRRSLEESAALLKEPMLAAWAIEPVRIQPYLEKLEAVSESRIILHPMQKKERMDALFREVAGDILSDADYRRSWLRRLEDAAWVFHKKGLQGQAGRLVHLCRYLGDTGRDASRVSFFVELVRTGMEGILQEKQTEEKGKPSLIIKP